ncbi:MAG: hypothetical protein RIE52_02015 [Balneola sp.]|jgi:hypothetical protein
MKYTAILLILSALLLACSSDKSTFDTNEKSRVNFSGKIVYEYSFKETKSVKDMTKQMSSLLGMQQHYFVNSGNYKALDENGEFKQLYNSVDNKYYFPNPNTNKIMEIDASLQMSEIVSVKEAEGTETILGRICKKVVVVTKTDETTYFYNSEIAVDPSKFSKHLFGGWSTYLEATNGALPLKYVVKNDNYTWTSTAIEITPTEIPEEEFVLENILR